MIHLDVPVPCHKGRASGSAWARGDSAVDIIVFSVPSWNGFTSKAMGVSGGIGNTAAFDAATAAAAAAAKMSVKDVSPSSGPRPIPWVLYEHRGFSDQAPRFESAVPPDTLRAVTSGSATTPSCASVGCNCANGVPVAAVPTDTLHVVAYGSAATPSRTGVGYNCANGTLVAAAATPSACFPACTPSPSCCYLPMRGIDRPRRAW